MVAEEQRSSKRFGRRAQLALLQVCDMATVALMLYSTRVQFAKAAAYTPTLNETYKIAGVSGGPIAGPINTNRKKLLYLIYISASLFLSSSGLYTLFAAFGQYSRRKAWEASHSSLAGQPAVDVYGVPNGRVTEMPRLPRDRCVDLTRYAYALAWLLAWLTAALGVGVWYLDRTGYEALGVFEVKARQGSNALAAGWVVHTVVGLWRVIYKIASSSG